MFFFSFHKKEAFKSESIQQTALRTTGQVSCVLYIYQSLLFVVQPWLFFKCALEIILAVHYAEIKLRFCP